MFVNILYPVFFCLSFGFAFCVFVSSFCVFVSSILCFCLPFMCLCLPIVCLCLPFVFGSRCIDVGLGGRGVEGRGLGPRLPPHRSEAGHWPWQLKSGEQASPNPGHPSHI